MKKTVIASESLVQLLDWDEDNLPHLNEPTRQFCRRLYNIEVIDVIADVYPQVILVYREGDHSETESKQISQ